MISLPLLFHQMEFVIALPVTLSPLLLGIPEKLTLRIIIDDSETICRLVAPIVPVEKINLMLQDGLIRESEESDYYLYTYCALQRMKQ